MAVIYTISIVFALSSNRIRTRWSEMVMRLQRSKSGEVTADKCHWLALVWHLERSSVPGIQVCDPAIRYSLLLEVDEPCQGRPTPIKQIWEGVVCMTCNDMLLTGCTQRKPEIRYPMRFESKQARSAWEVEDAARQMLATNFSTQIGRCDKLQQSWNQIKTA
jgi:hypothetical protein